ncbi:ATP-binding protein [Aquaspirillum soli]|jgi:two-component system sensor histidine kinase QseC
MRHPTDVVSASLQRRLLAALLIALPLVWIASAAFNLYAAHDRVNELFDTEQAFFAQMLASVNLEAQNSGLGIRPTSPRRLRELFEDSENDIDDDIIFQLRDASGRLVLSDVNYTDLPFRFDAIGFMDERVDGKMWRLFYFHDEDNGAYVMVGQRMSSRTKLVWRLALGQMLPWIVALPVLFLALWWGVRQGLKPLNQLKQDLAHRSPDNLTPITQKVPEEVQPLVDELNHLFARLHQVLSKERRFTADAAHELRTPLAALRVQTEVAKLSEDEVSRQRALNKILSGIDRATRLVEQLLTLARLDHLDQVPDRQRVDVMTLAASVMLELGEGAARRGVVVEPIGEVPALWIEGSPAFLSILLRNLIDNAIRYTPNGGRVWIESNESTLTVCDNGPGVEAAWLERVRERFSRPEGQQAEGSGLGLSIVERVALLHGLALHLANHPQGGFRATLRRQSN